MRKALSGPDGIHHPPPVCWITLELGHPGVQVKENLKEIRGTMPHCGYMCEYTGVTGIPGCQITS